MKATKGNASKPKLNKISSIISNDKDPVCLLYEIFGSVSSNFTLTTGVHNKCCFKVNIEVNGKRFSSSGTTYNLAKKSCALAALAELCEVHYDDKMQPYLHAPARSTEKVDREDVTIVSSTRKSENILNAGVLSSNEELLRKVNNSETSNDMVKISSQVVEQNLPVILEVIELDSISDSTNNTNNSKCLEKTNKFESNSNFLEGRNENVKTILIEDHEVEPKPSAVMMPLYSSKNVSSLIIEEIDNDGNVIPNGKKKNMKALQNITNKLICKASSIKTKISNIANKTIVSSVCNLKKSNNSKPNKKRRAKDSIKTNNLSLVPANYFKYSKANDNQTNVEKTIKRSPKDIQELLEQPPAKRPFTNDCQIICKLSQNKTDMENTQHTEKICKDIKKLYPNLKFTLEAEMGSTHASFFMVSAVVNGHKFYGHGKSEKLAKRDATRQILNKLGKHNKIKPNNSNSMPQCSQADNSARLNCQSLLQNKSLNLENCDNFSQLPFYNADIIEAKIMDKFQQLTSGRQEISEYKVLAGIVMTFNSNFEQAKVVSLATGTKCVNGGNICCNGSVLNDSHAEIIARRCFIKFLYSQLYWHFCSETEGDSIFEKNVNGAQYPFVLKSDIRFHLYISTAPCGDGRIFSFNNNNNRQDCMGPTFNNAQYGQLRTKVEGGMGTAPVGARYYPQTWDGVMLGEPLLTMSCSDKIARWNVVGIQGALLAQLMGPIYLTSIVLGSLFNERHLHRAMYGRIQNCLNYLPPPYRLNRPLLGKTSSEKRRNTCRVPSIGINWTLGDSNIEVISLPTGRQIYNDTSLLTKQKFFSYYINLLQNMPYLRGAYITNNYAEAKEMSRDFQNAKSELMAAFYHAGLGTWVRKPFEQNEFTINMF